MPIPVSCNCGRSFRVKDELAGKRCKCPACSAVVDIPGPAVAVGATRGPRQYVGFEVVEEEDAPPASRRRRPKPAKADGKSGGFGTTSAGVIGGIVAIVTAVVWFVVGLYFGRIFFYPPIMLVIGIIAIIKGLASRE